MVEGAVAALATIEEPVTMPVMGDRNRLDVAARSDFWRNVERVVVFVCVVVNSSVKLKSSLWALGIVVVVVFRFLWAGTMMLLFMTDVGKTNPLEREVSDVKIRYVIHRW